MASSSSLDISSTARGAGGVGDALEVRSTMWSDLRAAAIILAPVEHCLGCFILTQRAVLEVENGERLSAIVNRPSLGTTGRGSASKRWYIEAIDVSERPLEVLIDHTSLAR